MRQDLKRQPQTSPFKTPSAEDEWLDKVRPYVELVTPVLFEIASWRSTLPGVATDPSRGATRQQH